MNCPTCGAWSEVLDTRATASTDTTRRRRQCANGHRFATVEVYAQMVNAGAVSRALAAIARARALWSRNQRILADERTAAEIAEEHGLSVKAVHSIRRRSRMPQARSKRIC